MTGKTLEKMSIYRKCSAPNVFTTLVIVAALLNGANYYLKRIGAVDQENRKAYLAVHQSGGPYLCGPSPGQQLNERPYFEYLYRSEGAAVVLKLAKFMLIGGFLFTLFVVIARKRSRFARFIEAWPAYVLLGVITLGALFTYMTYGGWIVAAGVRYFLFLLVAVAGAWYAKKQHLEFLASCIGVLLVSEFILILLELSFGIPVHGYSCLLQDLPARMAGTFVMPNSLGIFAVVALAFYDAFSKSRMYLKWLIAVTFVLVIASGSATGLISLAVLLGVLIMRRLKHRYQLIAGIALTVLLLGMLFMLPVLTGRHEVVSSVMGEGGRIGTLYNVLTSSSIFKIMFGHGIGVGTNTAQNVLTAIIKDDFNNDIGLFMKPLDSTLTSLLVQTGIVGVVLFYLMLCWALLRDKRESGFYIVVILVSLTLNITELFPVEFLLGAALARSFVRTKVQVNKT